MTTKKTSRFFGLIRERSVPAHPASELPTIQPPVAQQEAAWPLMRSLLLTSHADEARLTPQEKRLAWGQPERSEEPMDASLSDATSKARLLLPALEQMRQTQAAMATGYLPLVDNAMQAAEVSGQSLQANRVEDSARHWPQQAMPQPQAPSREQMPVAASVPLKPIQVQDHSPAHVASTPTAVGGWQYTVMLQSADERAAETGATPAGANDESSLSKVFARIRAHAAKPPTPPAAAAKAPGFLNKLWAK